MRSAAILLGAALMLVVPDAAWAGAWTEPEGRSQILVGVTYSHAGAGFDDHGNPDAPVTYEKALVQIDAEYGWNDWLTLLLSPEYAHARLIKPQEAPQLGNAFGLAGGVRVRLRKDVGIVSAQLTLKAAGAFDTSVSAGGAVGRQIELRLLYGTGFSLFGRHGFFDAEIAQRWIAGARADEVPIDLTLGLRVTKRARLLLQSFNTIAQGNASHPYGYYRVHKISLSVVTDIRPGICLESGAYMAVAGQNALAEKGFVVRVWLRF